MEKEAHVYNKTQIYSPDFSFGSITKEFPLFVAAENARTEAQSVFEKIENSENWISSFSADNGLVLPVGIKEVVNEVEYQLAFAEAQFGMETIFKIFAKVVLPQSDKDGKPIELFFGANNIKLSKQGGLIGNGSAAGNANLVLLGDVQIPFHTENWSLTLNGSDNYTNLNLQKTSYVSIDCKGVTDMSIDGEVYISRNLLEPLQNNGEPVLDNTERVKASFTATATSWNDLIVSVELPPFSIANQADRFMFTSNEAVFDFSDSRNPENINFPQYYKDSGILLPDENTWRGICIKSLQVGLPKVFKTYHSITSKDRVYFKATDLLIDNYGVSGDFSAKDVISIDDGITSAPIGWPISVSAINLVLQNNSIIKSKFSGGIRLPIFDKIGSSYNDDNGVLKDDKNTSLLQYEGMISDEEYSTAITTLEEIGVPAFLATIKMRAGSYIKMPVVNNNFRPETNFNGMMTTIISSSKQREAVDGAKHSYTTDAGETEEGTNTIRFKGLTFEGLKMKTKDTLFTIDYLGYTEGVSFKKGGFSVSLDAITYKNNPEKKEGRIGFNISLGLEKEKNMLFLATTRFDIISETKIENNTIKLVYKDFKWSKIAFNAKYALLGLKGILRMTYDDPVYGNAYAGDGEFKLDFSKREKNKDKENGATNFFRGKFKTIMADDMSFYYFDGSAEFPTGFPIGPSGFHVNGFGFGYFDNMNRKMDPSSASAKGSPSGFSYAPAEGRYGFKCMVFGYFANRSLFRLGAGLEFNINKSGGLNSLSFIGQARGLNKMKDSGFPFKNKLVKQLANYEKLAKPKKPVNSEKDIEGRIKSEVRDTRSLSERASQEAAGTDVTDSQSLPDVDGVDAYLFGQFDFENQAISMHLEVYADIAKGIIIGRGKGTKAGEGILQINKDTWYLHFGNPINQMGLSTGFGDFRIDYGGYVMLGENLPKATPPPYRVATILGDKLGVLKSKRNNHSLSTGTGAAFGAGLEFDTGNLLFGPVYARFTAGIGFDVLLKKYDNVMTCNGISPIGSNGFYATGQFYTYMQGELGIGIDLFGGYRRFPIIKGGGAFLGKTGGPNPTWFQARFAANYNLLGGLIKGRINEDITIGDVCNPVPDNALGVEIISDFSPSNNDSNVDVFTSPQLALTMAANTPIQIPDVNKETKTYKIEVKTFSITDSKGKKIDGKHKWNPENDRITFESTDILPPNQELTAKVEVVFEEKIDGVFRTFKVNGEEFIEKRTHTFTTGDAPSYIPLSNIQYSYPVINQKLFYRNEHPIGYVKLKKGQDYLFENAQWKTQVKYTDSLNNTNKKTSLQYHSTNNELSYNIPKVDKEKTYTIKMVSTPIRSTNRTKDTSDHDIAQNDTTTGSTITIKKNKAETVIKDGEIERLSYSFSSSKYTTFKNKMKSITTHQNFIGKVYIDAIYLSSTIASHDEGFDIVELEGSTYSENKPLVAVNATLEDDYFKQDIAPMLYTNYPIAGKYTFRRNTALLGTAPSKAISVRTNYIASLKKDTDTEWRLKSFPYKYMLPKAYRDDFEDIMTHISDDYYKGILTSGDDALQFLDNRFGFMREGTYRTRLSYVLPGGIRKSYSLFDFKY
ncbi:hypothetical protein ACSTS3_01230 [Aquimarina muelleri]|uniref:hypothetical protein n=1 Tax=Aquimarina muelleri TaxID=279356 RepID=UPI003F6851BC